MAFVSLNGVSAYSQALLSELRCGMTSTIYRHENILGPQYLNCILQVTIRFLTTTPLTVQPLTDNHYRVSQQPRVGNLLPLGGIRMNQTVSRSI